VGHDHYNGHVTRIVTASEAKSKLLSLLDRVAEGEVVEITRHGRTVARLAPASGPHAVRGSLTGVAMTAASNDDLLTTGAEWRLDG
jgi:prevent-host-death family protein